MGGVPTIPFSQLGQIPSAPAPVAPTVPIGGSGGAQPFSMDSIPDASTIVGGEQLTVPGSNQPYIAQAAPLRARMPVAPTPWATDRPTNIPGGPTSSGQAQARASSIANSF